MSLNRFDEVAPAAAAVEGLKEGLSLFTQDNTVECKATVTLVQGDEEIAYYVSAYSLSCRRSSCCSLFVVTFLSFEQVRFRLCQP